MVLFIGRSGQERLARPQRSRDSRNQMMDASAVRAALDGKKYLNLETYRKSGKGVRTPVWFAVTPADAPAANIPRFYVYTTADSGKAKRIRRSGVVKIAPCDVRVGPWPANGSMPTPRSSAAKSSSAVCGLSTANTVRGSRSSIYLHCCFAVMNASCSRSGRSEAHQPPPVIMTGPGVRRRGGQRGGPRMNSRGSAPLGVSDRCLPSLKRH
jgi:hypothetical protein